MIKVFFIAALFLAGKVSAHEMTPTYPPLVPSYVDGLVSAKMTMFNARQDVEYFEVGVFDAEWKPHLDWFAQRQSRTTPKTQRC